MPIDEKISKVNIDVYSATLNKNSSEIATIFNIPNIEASFRYMSGTFQMIILTDILLEDGVAIADYNEQLDKIVLFYVYDSYGRLGEIVELGEYLNDEVRTDMLTKIQALLFKKKNPFGYIVDSYQDYEGKKITKLLPTAFEIKIYPTYA